ncbi:MAG: helix-turn-helix domain-containing protein [Clostridiales bacterium]|jgi:two-component system response regulator YesN|nr:helix-turn-helix domain-containing protein [Clostridiales bacterium]
MIKLLIADDEPLVCVGLQSMLPWREYGIEIAGTARNGQQAADMIEKLQPEIVIADIKMPLKSGLELARECNEIYGRLPVFIILTSYEEFDYVRQAMRSHVSDYLVKLELDAASLGEAVEKAARRVRDIIEIQPEQAVLATLDDMREKFFIQLLNGAIGVEKQFALKQKELLLNFNAPGYAVALCEVQPLSEAYGEKLLSLCTHAAKLAKETLQHQCECYLATLDMHHFAVVFALGPPREWKDGVRKMMEQTAVLLRSYLGVSIKVSVGSTVEDPKMLGASYQAALQVSSKGPNEDVTFSEEGESSFGKPKLLCDVQAYIKANLSKHLSLTEVAAVFNFSPSYLSQYFVKYAGINFVEYITAERVATAKKMLENGDALIYEIARQLGFENSFYFSKVFKKAEGVSPREYARKIREEGQKKGRG